MSSAGGKREYEVGYGKAPASSRFRKGQSGNPKGRPKNRTNRPPHDVVLGQMVTVREDGVERRLTAKSIFKELKEKVEQAKVVRATRTPHKVRWPEWWGVRV